jgi:hypothetical protein
MNRLVIAICLFLALGLTTLLVLSACGDDPPTSSGPPIDYSFYYCEVESTPKLCTLYPATGHVDSVTIPWVARHGISVSADGRRLYLATAHTIVVVDAETLSMITELPYQSDDWVGVSPDDRLLAIAYGGLHVLSTDDYSVVFQDTIPVLHCEFSSDSRTLYCARKGTDSVYQVDLTDPAYPVTLTSTGYGWVHFVIPTPDESKLLLYKNVGSGTFAFEVYEKALDSIIFRDLFRPGYGTLAMTPDGRYAFYTSPGSILMGAYPLLGFKVFDIRANAIDTVIEDPDFFGNREYPYWLAPPTTLAVTPDSRWLGSVGGGAARFVAYSYDILKKKPVTRLVPPGGALPFYSNISAQKVR